VKLYRIKSPSGKVLLITAETFYQAVNMAVAQDGMWYSIHEYYAVNKKTY